MVVQISDLSARQLANGLIIFAAALPYGHDATKAALMTALAESSLLRYANNGESTRPEVWAAYGGREAFRTAIRQSLVFSHDAEAGAAWTTADSLGLYQQRPSMGYGSVADLMDPTRSTLIFLRGVPGQPRKVRHWSREDKPKSMTIAQAAQWIQGSEFPTGDNYAPMETVANQLITHFGGFPTKPPTDNTTDWIDMADQGKLDDYRAQIKADVWAVVTDPNLLALQNKSLFAQDTGQGSSYAAQLAEQTRLLQEINARLVALESK